NLDVNNTINSIAANKSVMVIDPSDVLCDTKCLVVVDGQPIYRDDDHLSTIGAYYISFLFNPLFEDLITK
ncbi:MAG: SGNH hydrolase domain-containing protein, partial [Anaerolineae bacterium]